MADRSEKRAWEIIRHHAEKLSACPGLLSVVLVGSLTNGSYTGNAGSDIDMVHILKDDAPENARKTVLELMAETERETGKDLPIARCVYRLSELKRPYNWDFVPGPEMKDYMELPIEVLRMKESGRVIWGENIIPAIDMPQREDMLMIGAKADEQMDLVRRETPEFYEQYMQNIAHPSDRILAQIVLTRAMKDVYFASGKSCSSKKAVRQMAEENFPGYAFLRLLELAEKWRYEPSAFTEEDSSEMQSLYADWLAAREGKPYDFVPLNR